MNPFDKEVAAGAALLDSECPGWFDDVDTHKLSMADCELCILGQVYGLYQTGLRAFDVDPVVKDHLAFAQDHGFTATGSRYWRSAAQDSWFQLGKAWVSEIRARREAS